MPPEPPTAWHGAAPRPELLFISPAFPLPLDRGQHVRIHHLLRACARDFAVTFVGPPPEKGAFLPELERLGIRVILAHPAPAEAVGLGRMVRHALATREVATRRRVLALAPYRSALEGLDLGRFRVAWVERGHLAVLARSIRDRTIVDLDDLEHVKAWRALRAAGTPRRRPRMAAGFLRLLWREAWGLRRFAALVVCSGADRQRLERAGNEAVMVVPNGADIVSGAVPEPGGKRDAVFLGNCGYAPNKDAIAWLRESILPRLRLRRPSFAVDLIGPQSEAHCAPEEGLFARGFVADLPRELARYRVFVAPLRLGGGTKLKVIEAMAAGVPVVTSRIGAEGLGIVDGEHALVADEAGAFADAVVRILDDPALGAELARNARALVGRTLSWDAIRQDVADGLKARFAA